MKSAVSSCCFCVDNSTQYSYNMFNSKGVFKLTEVAKRMKDLRENVYLSQAKIAALMGATQASVNRYENEQSSPPLKVLLWYADFFDVSLDYIFGRTDKPQGILYEHQPKVIEAVSSDSKEMRKFVDMCFDPASPVSEKLRDMLAQMLREQGK